jgi:shikimate kinase
MRSTSDAWLLRPFEPRARKSIAARYHASIATTSRTDLSGRPIALAGFMGVGKTTIGRLLAERLARPFYDTDGYVEAATGRSVEDFFLKQQEPEFRQREADAVKELVANGAVVIALGGGALLDEGSRSLLRERSVLVHLHVPWNELRQRVPSLMATRPLMRGRTMDEIHQLYLDRQATYRSAALRIDIGHRSPAEAAAEILLAVR